MSPTVKTHPLAEIIAKRLFGIETVPGKEQRRMVNRAVKDACEYHNNRIKELEEALSKAMRCICLTRDYVGPHILPATEGWEWYDAGILISKLIPDDSWSAQFLQRVNKLKG